MQERQPQHPCITFTEREKLADRVGNDRFMELVSQTKVDIHEVELSTNSFGEFLFVTVSCHTEYPRHLLTFWGLGYHEYRERWIVDTWQWHESYRHGEALPVLRKESALNQIRDREVFINKNIPPRPTSKPAPLYDLL